MQFFLENKDGQSTFLSYCAGIFGPFIEKKFPNKYYVFQQDNDPKQVSHYSREKFEDYGITTVSWPSESPGLNVIECLWHELKDYLRNEKKTGG